MKSRRDSVATIRRNRDKRSTVFDLNLQVDEREVNEERLVYIKILRSQYYKLIEHGKLESRGFIPHSLFRSLDYEEDRAAR